MERSKVAIQIIETWWLDIEHNEDDSPEAIAYQLTADEVRELGSFQSIETDYAEVL